MITKEAALAAIKCFECPISAGYPNIDLGVSIVTANEKRRIDPATQKEIVEQMFVTTFYNNMYLQEHIRIRGLECPLTRGPLVAVTHQSSRPIFGLVLALVERAGRLAEVLQDGDINTFAKTPSFMTLLNEGRAALTGIAAGNAVVLNTLAGKNGYTHLLETLGLTPATLPTFLGQHAPAAPGRPACMPAVEAEPAVAVPQGGAPIARVLHAPDAALEAELQLAIVASRQAAAQNNHNDDEMELARIMSLSAADVQPEAEDELEVARIMSLSAADAQPAPDDELELATAMSLSAPQPDRKEDVELATALAVSKVVAEFHARMDAERQRQLDVALFESKALAAEDDARRERRRSDEQRVLDAAVQQSAAEAPQDLKELEEVIRLTAEAAQAQPEDDLARVLRLTAEAAQAQPEDDLARVLRLTAEAAQAQPEDDLARVLRLTAEAAQAQPEDDLARVLRLTAEAAQAPRPARNEDKDLEEALRISALVPQVAPGMARQPLDHPLQQQQAARLQQAKQVAQAAQAAARQAAALGNADQQDDAKIDWEADELAARERQRAAEARQNARPAPAPSFVPHASSSSSSSSSASAGVPGPRAGVLGFSPALAAVQAPMPQPPVVQPAILDEAAFRKELKTIGGYRPNDLMVAQFAVGVRQAEGLIANGEMLLENTFGKLVGQPLTADIFLAALEAHTKPATKGTMSYKALEYCVKKLAAHAPARRAAHGV